MHGADIPITQIGDTYAVNLLWTSCDLEQQQNRASDTEYTTQAISGVVE